LKVEQADIIITDVNMPRLDGSPSSRSLRKDKRNRATPVLVLTTETARASRSRAQAALRAGSSNLSIRNWRMHRRVRRDVSAPDPAADVMERIKGVFFQDCDDRWVEPRTGLLALQRCERDAEIVNTVFRAGAFRQGRAGTLGRPLVAFAIFRIGDGRRQSLAFAARRRGRGYLLRAADVLADHVKVARDGGKVDAERAGNIGQALSSSRARGPKTEPKQLLECEPALIQSAPEQSTSCWTNPHSAAREL